MADITRLLQMSAGIVTGVDLGSSNLKLDQVSIRDTGGDHYLTLDLNENLTADRILSIVVSDAARSLTISGDSSINQSLLTTASPEFAGLTLTSFSGVLKATAGVVAGGATMDDIADGATYGRVLLSSLTSGEVTKLTDASGDDMTVALGGANRVLTLGSSVSLNQNLQTTDSPTFVNVTISTMGTAATDAATKGYVDGAINGLDWQNSVLDKQVDATLDPGASPATGARYIIEDSAALHANFGSPAGLGNDDIIEFTGSVFEVVWDASVEGEGGATWVEDDDEQNVFNGTAWVKLGSTVNHNNLAGLQGGTTNEYYHLTSAQHTNLTSSTPSFGGLTLTTGDITTTAAAMDWDLIDNNASALSFDATGKAGILEIDTTDGVEGIKMSGYLNIGASTAISSILDEDNMASDSATALATQQSIKAYVDGAVSGAAPDGLDKSVVLGEAMGTAAEDHIFPVRYALSGETAGRVYKADKDAIGNAYAIGFVATSGVVAIAGSATMTFGGSVALGADDTPFGAGDIGKPVYTTGNGTFSVTPPSTVTEAVYQLGIVETTTSIEVLAALNGVN